MTNQPNPFVRDSAVNKPGIIGARWWNNALQVGSSTHGRRAALIGIGVVAVGVLGVGGLIFWAASRSRKSGEDVKEEPRKALDMQRDYGWSFGAVSETVAFDTLYTQPYARAALKTLESDLSPKGANHTSHYVPSLFQSPEALPRLTLPDGETERVKPLAEALKPMLTPVMKEYEKRGAGYGSLISKSDAGVLTVVDLAGPEAVAFAAGASKYLDPIMLFDNWPHPRGVVPAHETLAAAVYYQPLFAKNKAARPATAMPMAVLDRRRLTTYVDDATKFDNRYLAKVPSPKALSVKRVMYVVATSSDLPEQDDLNAAFLEWGAASVEVRSLAATAFDGGPEPTDEYFFGGTASGNDGFFSEYKWKKSATTASAPVSTNRTAALYKPVLRPSAQSTVSAPSSGGGGIGYVPVVIAVGTGVLIGSRLNRSGSYNRTSSGNYGGG